MRSIQVAEPNVDFQKPDTAVSVSIDPATGCLATPDCPTTRTESYIAGTEPSEYCPEHGAAAGESSAPSEHPEADLGIMVPQDQGSVPLDDSEELR
jgi:membrane carboxypeptidase/penicillin-binding protein